MTITSLYKRIDEKAYQLLLRLNALVLPVDVAKIAELLNLSVQEKALEDEYSGFLAVREKTIVVNSLHAPVRRRFTIGHELGHYQLHRRRKIDQQVFIDRTVYFRKGGVDEADYQMELEANAFAAGLLMPEVLLDEYLDKHWHIDLNNSADIKMLAEEFEVSKPAMEYRLKNLGFVLPTSF